VHGKLEEMIEWLDPVRDLSLLAMMVRVVLAMVISGVMGIERSSRNQPAGFRTYMLVCLGAALVMMTNQYISEFFKTGDPSRLGAQVISGIGFLGAGTIILTKRNQVRGLTTAAGLWAAACTGLAIGIGYYEGAIFVGLSIFVVMRFMRHIDAYLFQDARVVSLYLNFESVDYLNFFMEYTKNQDWKIMDMQVHKSRDLGPSGLIVFMIIKLNKRIDHHELVRKVSEVKGLIYVEEI